LKSIRESTYLTVQFAGAHLGQSFWNNPPLASIIPQALVTDLDVMEDRHLKLLFRHVMTALIGSCPNHVRPPWLTPIFTRLMPHMHERLVTKWAAVTASASGSSAAANGGQQQQQQQLSEEVVGETLLREMTREYMAVLAKATERGLPVSSGISSGSSGAAAAAAAAAALAGPPASEEQQSVLEALWKPELLQQLPLIGTALQALVATAVAGMCWPDTQSAGKATKICM
jgi:exportin-5